MYELPASVDSMAHHSACNSCFYVELNLHCIEKLLLAIIVGTLTAGAQ